jgi:putative MATE family efflux protein
MPLALAYLRVIFIAVPGMLTMTLLMMSLRGSGDSLTPLWFMGLSVVLDSSLNPVFILGLGPAPRLGIAGSATATAVATYVSLAAMLVYTYRRDLPLRLRGSELRYLKPDTALLSTMVRKGLPMGLQMIVITSSALAILSLVNRQGVITTAAYGVTQQLWTYVQMPAMALGAAVSAMAAQNIGAGRWDRVSHITRSGVIYNVAMTGTLVLVLTIVDRPALELFLGQDSPALPVARHIQLVATWGFIAFGVSLVLFGTIRANGQVIWPLLILFISMYPVRLGFVSATDQWLGADALWLSFPVGMVSTMLMAIVLYRGGGWKRSSIAPQAIDQDECVELARADAEPGGAFQPTG